MSESGKKRKELRNNPNNEIGQFGCWKKRQKPNQHLLFKELKSTIKFGIVRSVGGKLLLIPTLRYQTPERKSTTGRTSLHDFSELQTTDC
jgi:hypothetical protein